MTTDLAAGQRLHDTLGLAERDREAAEAGASGLRDAKAANTHRSYGSTGAWSKLRQTPVVTGHCAPTYSPWLSTSAT